MRRRSPIANDSMDLLLDTITNTFGGILLLALLLVLLIRQTSDPKISPQATSPARIQQIEARLQELSAVRESLQQSIAAQQITTQLTADKVSEELIAQLSTTAKELGRAKAVEAEQAAQANQMQRELDEHAAQMSQMQAELSKLLSELSHAEDVVKQEQAARTRTMDLPREEETYKPTFVVVVKNNQLHLLRDESGPAAFNVNAAHFEKCSPSEADVVLSSGDGFRVRSNSGVTMETAELIAALSKIDASDYFLTIVIAPDSFEKFTNLRAACVQLGLEHRILPVDDFPVYETRGAARQSAQ